MKKPIALLLTAAMIFSLTACGNSTSTSGSTTDTGSAAAPAAESAASSESEGGGTTSAAAADTDISGTTLEVAVTYTGDQATVFNKLVEDFQTEYGCTVNVAEYGTDYENTMKTRMASNELPDIWQTHGWSILRYKEYLMNLKDQPWVADYDESALGVIQDSDGSIYTLMISELINGTLVNLDICEEAGVDPYAIHTWAEFTEACAKVKEAGYTAIGANSNPGLFANPGGTWVSYKGEQAEDSAAMLDGTYDWASFKPWLQQYADWMDAGYFYEDILSMNDNDLTERYASGRSAFIIGNDPSVLLTCLTLNPDVNYAFLPHFASKDGGSEFIGIGEGDAFGIWKDTKNEAAAKVFLEYMARPEVAQTMNDATGKISCLKSTMANDKGAGLAYFTTMKEKCADCNIFYENLWDRQYMPSGMWPIFGNAANMLFDDHSEAGVQATLDYLSENYLDLYEAAQTE